MVGGEGVLQNAYLNDGKMAWSSPFGLKLTKEPLLAVSAVLHQVPDTKFQFQQVIFSPFQSQLSGQFSLLISVTVSLGLSIKRMTQEMAFSIA